MSSGKMICFRVDDGQKARIDAAAATQGKSSSTFVKETVMSAVEKVESRRPKQAKPHDDVPTWFRAFCREAAKGGSFGFHRVGYRFANSMPPDDPLRRPYGEWEDEQERLRTSLQLAQIWDLQDAKRRDALTAHIWDWFAQNFPNAMKLIPGRRRSQFVLGFLDHMADEIRRRNEPPS
jgi:hypothetical protein